MNLHTAVLLNGPPNSGKDTLAFMLEEYGFKKLAMKDQLYIDTAKHFDVPLDVLINRASDRFLKEQPWDTTGLSPRQKLIHTSEHYIKPNFGKDYFGKAAVANCQKQNATLAVFSDGGFASEIAPLQAAYENVVIFRLFRAGCDFEGDSRDYLRGFDNTYDLPLVNNKPRAALAIILGTVDQYIAELKIPA